MSELEDKILRVQLHGLIEDVARLTEAGCKDRATIAAKDAEIARLARLGEQLKQAILSNATLLAEATQLRGALPALWGQYDDEGRKLWIDPKDAEIVRLREALEGVLPFVSGHEVSEPWKSKLEAAMEAARAALKGKGEGK